MSYIIIADAPGRYGSEGAQVYWLQDIGEGWDHVLIERAAAAMLELAPGVCAYVVDGRPRVGDRLRGLPEHQTIDELRAWAAAQRRDRARDRERVGRCADGDNRVVPRSRSEGLLGWPDKNSAG